MNIYGENIGKIIEASRFQGRCQENPIGRLLQRGVGRDSSKAIQGRFLSRKEEESSVEASLNYDYSVWPYEAD